MIWCSDVDECWEILGAPKSGVVSKTEWSIFLTSAFAGRTNREFSDLIDEFIQNYKTHFQRQ